MTPTFARLFHDAMRPRPAFTIRAASEGGLGLHVCTVPAGVARNESEAVAWYRKHRQAPLFHAATIRAVPVTPVEPGR